MTSSELRSLFLEFFEGRGHKVVASSSLVPSNDPTLLFTNAGMVQFKDIFLGREDRHYLRATSSQRCVRAGGKHNDLENVGYTARHHTFFEMLGNFSFGDYFKREAISLAWTFLTAELGISPERLWITIFDQDKEAESIWLNDVGVNPDRFSRIGTKDNFWSMGDTGPCGPCTEIFYDHGAHIPGGPPGSIDEDGDRYIEIWNLVFMQYERSADGNLSPLPKPSVDTGMGLERIAAVLQGVHSNYETDLFRPLVTAAAKIASLNDTDHSSLRVLADHIRSCSFLISDGVLPSNEGRGYVLRRIIRRAIRHGYKLGIRDIFFYKMVEPLCAVMGEAYPELASAQSIVEQVLRKEEQRFAETLEQGMKILESQLMTVDHGILLGETVFQLYDTYGFPVDLTADIAREHGIVPDLEGFDRAMQAQRERGRAASHFTVDYSHDLDANIHCQFSGYELLDDESNVVGLYKDGQSVDRLVMGDKGAVVLLKTPFYAESGGQIGDCGILRVGDAVFEVLDTQKQGTDTILHYGKVKNETIYIGASVRAEVNAITRKAIAVNHSATHLLHAALRMVLGDHVLQKGSLVNAQRLRFDFSHYEPLTLAELDSVECIVNEQIRANHRVLADQMSREEAMNAGAMALFGEKYGDEVRVLRIGSFSTELCGGIHAERAGDIGLFKIVSETGVASGIRRIEAVTGKGALDWVKSSDRLLLAIAERIKAGRDQIEEKIQQIVDRNRVLEKELERLKGRLASLSGDELVLRATDVAGIKILAVKVDESDPKLLRELVDQLRNKLGRSVVVLGMVSGGKVSLIAGVSKDIMDKIRAGDVVNFVAMQVGGKGGGKPDLAQAGGNNPAQLEVALNGVIDWVTRQITTAN